MTQTTQRVITQQRARLSSASASLIQARQFFIRYRQEVMSQYQGLEASLVLQACNECIQCLNRLTERMERVGCQLLWLEHSTL